MTNARLSQAQRKRREVEVLAASAEGDHPAEEPPSCERDINRKFETDKAQRVNSCEFEYEYQRADLAVRSPGVYAGAVPTGQSVAGTLYTGSGMAALTATLLALKSSGFCPLADAGTLRRDCGAGDRSRDETGRSTIKL